MKTDCENYTEHCDEVYCYECGKWQEKNADEKCRQCRKESYYQFCEVCSVNGHVGILNEEIK